MRPRICILASHPIQYQVPWFRKLAERSDLVVCFAKRPNAEEQGAGFGRAFQWDIDLLSGYPHQFLTNKSNAPRGNGFSAYDTPEMANIIQAGVFDTVIVSGWFLKCYWQAVMACRRSGIPVLVRGDSHLLTPTTPVRRLLRKLLYPTLLRAFDGFLVVGKRNAAYLRHYGVPDDKMFFAPHCVDTERFEAAATLGRNKRSVVRARFGASDPDLVVLFVGKFQPIKRAADILRAAAILLRYDVSVIAVLVGAGEQEGELRKLSAALRVSVCFEGFKNQSELSQYYASADVLVLPSESETWGLVVNEAMASGLPCVVSDVVGCAPDLVDEGHTGFTFPVGDCGQLADRLLRVAALKAARHDFTTALRKKSRDFSAEAAAAGTLNAIRVLHSVKRPPAQTL